MSEPVIAEHDVTVYQGDVREQLAAMEPQSVQCIVTSPPYYRLRDYGVKGQRGQEETPAEFVAALLEDLRAAKRVLADDGVLWLNLGDSYSTRKIVRDSSHQPGMHPDRLDHETIGKSWAENAREGKARMPAATGLPEKNLLMIPARVAIASQDDGWILRNDIIWAKPNGMPESVQDRLGTKHEHVFLMSKSRRYWFDLDPIREPLASTRVDALTWDRPEQRVLGQRPQHRPGRTWDERKSVGVPARRGSVPIASVGDSDFAANPGGRNPGDVWTVPTQPFSSAHFATMPPELARRCILAGCPEGGTVLDPFAGSGTTLKVARSLGRNSIGIELNPDYIDIIRERIGDTPFDFGASA